VHEICKNIPNLWQEKRLSWGRIEIVTPDTLYATYISVIADLSKDVSLLLITLCLSNFSALTTNLKDKIEEDISFCMPVIGCMLTKMLKFEGIHTVRLAAVVSFKKINEEENRIRRICPQLNWSRYGSTYH